MIRTDIRICLALLFVSILPLGFWSLLANFSCNLNLATISNNSGNSVQATIEVRRLLSWRGKIENDRTRKVLYKARDDGQMWLTVESRSKKFEARGGAIFFGADPDKFVIEPDHIVNATAQSNLFFDSLLLYGACTMHPIFDLTSRSDIVKEN
jgi:hypothetical protein